MNKYLLFILILLVVSGIGYGLHSLVLTHWSSADLHDWWIGTGYSLKGMYGVCAVNSLIMVFLLLGVDFAMPKFIGFAFMIGLFLKAIASYIYIQAGLNLLENDFIELNFIAVFFLYLFYDAFVAYFIVNQQEVEVKK